MIRWLLVFLIFPISLIVGCAPPASSSASGQVAPTPTATTIPVPSPQPAAAVGGIQEVADTAGEMVPWAHQSRTPQVAIHPERGSAAATWIAWGGTNSRDTRAGDVWARRHLKVTGDQHKPFRPVR